MDTLNTTLEGSRLLIRQALTQLIFPNINFTCETNITGWTFVGSEFDGNISNVIPPCFQVWRQINSTFHLIGSSNMSAISASHPFPSGTMIYTLTVEPITVQPGDMYGILFTTADSDNRTLIPHFISAGAGSFIYYITFLNSADVASLNESDLMLVDIPASFPLLVSVAIESLVYLSFSTGK